MRRLILCSALLACVLDFPVSTFAQRNESVTDEYPLLALAEPVNANLDSSGADLPSPAPISSTESNVEEHVSSVLTSKMATGTADMKTAKSIPVIAPYAFILPVSLMGVGTASLLNENMRKANDYAKERIYSDGYENRIKIDDYTMVAPAIAVYGLNLAGIRGRNNFVDRTIILGMSTLICNSAVMYTKKLTGITRPDNSNIESFPSGHTASAFMTAEFLRQEYKNVSPWYGVAGYASAIATGYLRMYHNKHWLNDVIAGAGVGIVSTRISYWLYPKLKSLIPQSKGKTMVAPSYNNGAYGVSMVYSFE